MNNKFFAHAEAFVTVVRCNSITLAASELKTTKSNISQRLADFEAHLDLKLLRRTTRKMELTPAGERLYQTCAKAVDATMIAAAEIGHEHQTNTQPAGRVTISGSSAYLTSIIIPIIRPFLQSYPDIEPIFIGSDRRVDFAAEDIDIGYRIGPVRTESFLATPAPPLERQLCASPEFLRMYELIKHPKDLALLPCIQREQEKPLWRFQRGEDTASHQITDPAITVNIVEMARAAVINGLGLCVLASAVIEQDIRDGQLQQVLPEWKISPIPVTLLCRQSRLIKPQVRALHKFLTSQLNG
ncbi:MAG: LysR family transcriptional regulator [Rhizobiaceae bacterium]